MSSAFKRRLAYACVAGAVMTAAAMTMRIDGRAPTSARPGRGTPTTIPSPDLSATPAAVTHDPRLRRWRVGIQITGEDYENPPPAQALAMRHLADNVRGFTVYGDYSRRDPQRAIVDAVADGRIDTAAVWGPLAGYFASRSS